MDYKWIFPSNLSFPRFNKATLTIIFILSVGLALSTLQLSKEKSRSEKCLAQLEVVEKIISADLCKNKHPNCLKEKSR